MKRQASRDAADYISAIGGAVALVWGLVGAIRSNWVHTLLLRTGGSSRLTVWQTRLIGVILSVVGAGFLILSSLGILPTTWK
ncbi:hypothetical protein BHD05_08165 [Marisediminicola antarctica]|uniref:Uncharacterized protein n=1 Tax=Marisediminicola antarctica TaxID=674079 RepID=A0A7L5AMV4_9MICO|nr:hypothetical protein BHD05_08165 [Marisediminicola antarctica]